MILIFLSMRRYHNLIDINAEYTVKDRWPLKRGSIHMKFSMTGQEKIINSQLPFLDFNFQILRRGVIFTSLQHYGPYFFKNVSGNTCIIFFPWPKLAVTIQLLWSFIIKKFIVLDFLYCFRDRAVGRQCRNLRFSFLTGDWNRLLAIFLMPIFPCVNL
jgi:hypothetical protein